MVVSLIISADTHTVATYVSLLTHIQAGIEVGELLILHAEYKSTNYHHNNDDPSENLQFHVNCPPLKTTYKRSLGCSIVLRYY